MGLSWGDLNPASWPGQVKRRLEKDFGSSDEQKQQQANLNNQGAMASVFADQGQQGYGAMTAEMAADRERLRRLASGQDSVSAEQLRQGMQQNVNAQRSMAASASPQNAVMASRNAMNNATRAGIGMSGQAAMAGLQERQDAARALAQMNLGQRGQDIEVGLGSRQNAISGYGGTKPQPTFGQQLMAGFAAAAPAFLSDERLKKDVKDGTGAARRALEKLSAKTYEYKDERHGKGKQLGFLAQDLEKAGVKSAVIETPIGKAIDGAKLAGANTAMLASVAKRLSRLEKGRK